jgi:CheY-like chemotaxis protein/signal transduction histidine kinase
VALASKYKSQFLANMSHELRTPLNSLLLLAQGLAENKDGNLTDEQAESAKVIHDGGYELLTMINDILDLSKIEAGRIDLHIDEITVSDIAEGVRASFHPMCQEKGLSLEVLVNEDTPSEITTDRKRVEQILRNLVSNAVKFTEKGGVSVIFGQLSLVNGHQSAEGNDQWPMTSDAEQSEANDAAKPPMTTDGPMGQMTNDRWLSITVKDTGIGMTPEDQKKIFEAFQQANGGTARKYGGTGLGLSIARELASLLGGEIQLKSEPGRGSTFSLYLPIQSGALERGAQTAEGGRKTAEGAFRNSEFRVPRSKTVSRFPFRAPSSVPDDRESLEKGDRAILVIEDDPKFARLLCDKCHDRGFKCLAAPTGEAGLDLVSKYLPHGVILDIRLPGMDGWTVLGTLKDDIRTRHIPVHVISVEEETTKSLQKGAIAHVTKPLNQEELENAFKRIEETLKERTKRVLLVEDEAEIRRSVKQLIGNGDVKVDEVATGEQAIEALRGTRYGCLILDLGLPDMNGGELLRRVRSEGIELPPVIIHTARDLTEQEEMDLREHAESIVIKDVRSQERLLDEVSLFLHRMVEKMPEKKKQVIQNLYETDVLLKDKKVLVVDDDMRTTFALSRILSERGMKPLKAGNGEQALQVLEQEPDVDLVLMDIMMPVMDGYEAIRRIRSAERETRKIPIIALTAKAMPEDRKTCIEAGANDYLSKPVDQERLISMMRVWLYR